MSMHSCIRMYTSYNLIKPKSPHDRTVKLLIAVKDDELLQRLPLLQTSVVSAATGIHVHAESMVAGMELSITGFVKNHIAYNQDTTTQTLMSHPKLSVRNLFSKHKTSNLQTYTKSS
uniref:Uncharacterized protein n=1 Tax=Triticum urartu TaxID=4572 RepID=A0A8R7UMV0_TRIUA